MRLMPGVTGTAVLSPDGRYRYTLTRAWDPGLPKALWVMLNPSTAAADVDDQTLRRVQDYSRRWGLGGVLVVNLFALRATKPTDLYRHPDPVGPDNDYHLRKILTERVGTGEVSPPLAVAAWGAHGGLRGRDRQVLQLVEEAGHPLHVLGLTLDRHPRHPSRLSSKLTPLPWKPEGLGQAYAARMFQAPNLTPDDQQSVARLLRGDHG